MPTYQLQIKQVVDYPRCRIYRQFVRFLMEDRSIRVSGGSGLFNFTVLCSYANFRTSYRRIDGISYTVYPGEWVCTLKELSQWFRTRFQCQALAVLERLQKQHLISFQTLGHGNVGLVALIGISGESLSQFLVIFLKYLRNRRVVGGDGEQPEDKAAPSKSAGKHLKQRPPKEKKPKAPKRRRSGEADFPAEFDEVRSYEIREKLRPKKNAKKERPAKANKAKKKAKKCPEKGRLPKRPAHVKEQKPACLNPVADYLPIEKVENGIIYTKDHRFVKVVEVVPINFMLRSAREQRNIIYSFVSYLKISPVKLQIKVLTRRADINRHLDTVRREMAHEENEQCRLMQEDYLNFVQQVGSREAVTRRFFLIFEYEPWANTRRSEQEDEAIQSLQSAVHTASNYLRQCGNEVIVPENEDEFTVDVLYTV